MPFRSHREEVFVRELAAGGRARDGDRRLAQACVTKSRGAAVTRELPLVDVRARPSLLALAMP